MSLTLIAIIRAKPGRADSLEQHLHNMLAPSRAEAGCLQYDLHRDIKDADLIYMIEQWRDEEALAEHEASPHFQALLKASEPDLAELDIRLMNRID
ncbi:putative quinol monooxygenase [Pseudomonas sp. NY15181]|uniref:putative quinol monooxygenase n=1 Tax=Pseudomonas sp. NY15181 TaxID=3400349 RepID=UPI003A84BCC3